MNGVTCPQCGEQACDDVNITGKADVTCSKCGHTFEHDFGDGGDDGDDGEIEDYF